MSRIWESFTIAESLHHLHLLLVINATEQLALLYDVQIAFLQPNAAHDAHKASQVEDIVARSHHQLLRSDALRTAQTLLNVQSEKSGTFRLIQCTPQAEEHLFVKTGTSDPPNEMHCTFGPRATFLSESYCDHINKWACLMS